MSSKISTPDEILFYLLKRRKMIYLFLLFSDLAVLLVFSCFVFSVWHCWVALIQIGLKNGLPRVTDYPLWHQSRFWNPDLAPVGLTPRYQTNYFPATDLTHGVQFFGTIFIIFRHQSESCNITVRQ